MAFPFIIAADLALTNACIDKSAASYNSHSPKLKYTTNECLTLLNSLFYDMNQISTNGGAIYIFNHLFDLTMRDCLFARCSVDYPHGGGAVFANTLTTSIIRSYFFNCTAYCFQTFYVRTNFFRDLHINQTTITHVSFHLYASTESSCFTYCGHQFIENFNSSFNHLLNFGAGFWIDSPDNFSMDYASVINTTGSTCLHLYGGDGFHTIQNINILDSKATSGLILQISRYSFINCCFIRNIAPTLLSLQHASTVLIRVYTDLPIPEIVVQRDQRKAPSIAPITQMSLSGIVNGLRKAGVEVPELHF